MERQVTLFSPSLPPTEGHGTNASAVHSKLCLLLDQRAWLEFLADEWWPLRALRPFVRLGVGRPCGKKETNNSPSIVVWINPEQLPPMDVQVRQGARWSTAPISDLDEVDEVLWPAPIPLFAVLAFSVESEVDKRHLFALAKGFSNLALPQQEMKVERVNITPDVAGPSPPVDVLPLPHFWNAMRGAAAMAAWSVPAVAPWLDVLCNALAEDPDDSPARNLGATWWTEPPWRRDSNSDTNDSQVILWRAILQELRDVRFREDWRPLAIVESVRARIEAVVSSRWLEEWVNETQALLNDERRVDLERGETDPVGLAFQLVLLRPTPERFVTWKDDLRGMPPGVWWTGATLSGFIRGFSDLHPRFRGSLEGRRVLAVRTWQLAAPAGAKARNLAWPGLSDPRPFWRREDGRVHILWDQQIWAERTESSRGKWFFSDLQNPVLRNQALQIARQLHSSAVTHRICLSDSLIRLDGDEKKFVSLRGSSELEIKGEVSFVLPSGGRIIDELDEVEFRSWLVLAGIPYRLRDPFSAGRDMLELMPIPSARAGTLGAPKQHGAQSVLVEEQPTGTDEKGANGRHADEVDEAEDETHAVPGLSIVRDFLTAEEEASLIASIDACPWRSDLSRRVQHYGWKYDYEARRVDAAAWLGPLPPWSGLLVDRLLKRGLLDELPDQMIVNEYLRSQGISKHVDCISCFRGSVVTISLCESWEMIFRGPRRQKVAIALPQRSAVIIGGEARVKWSHEIPKRLRESWGLRGRRVSVTYRKVTTSRETS